MVLADDLLEEGVALHCELQLRLLALTLPHEHVVHDLGDPGATVAISLLLSLYTKVNWITTTDANMPGTMIMQVLIKVGHGLAAYMLKYDPCLVHTCQGGVHL